MFERMNEMINSFIATCCKYENQYEGLTKFVYNRQMKEHETKLNKAYKEGNLVNFIITMNNMKNDWMNGLTKFTQEEMKL